MKAWISEHGADYDVPAEIADAEALDDLSWHNDVCPSFGKQVTDPETGDVHDVRLWVEHPDPAQRESSSDARFAVNYQPWSAQPVPGLKIADDGDLYAGDDAAAALAALGEAMRQVHAEMARRAREKGAGDAQR